MTKDYADEAAEEAAYNLSAIDAREHPYKIRIPQSFKFPLAWTLIFVIIGIIIQSIQSSSFVFFRFFLSNYGHWVVSLGAFVQVQVYQSTKDFINALAGGWYYFFYTGGLISLLWALISWIVHSEIRVQKDYPE